MIIKRRIKDSILMLVLCLFAAVTASAQIPLVYDVENTGAACTKPSMPTLANLTAYAMLPDPFKWANGSGRITSFADWTCRRNEIKSQIENYEIGIKPVKPSNITATWTASTSTLTVKVTEGSQTLTLTSKIVLPAGAGPFPAVIGMNSATGSLPANVFSSRNIAQITYNHDQVTTYNNKSANDPFYKLYPNLASNGQYSAWAWGVSRLIDGLELVKAQLPIDTKHLAVTGCSYAGKMALFAGAFDERIALTIPQESGGGGAAAWRVSETLGAVEKLGATNNQWFMQSMFQFAGNNVTKLPHDHHELLAMVAPRALFVLANGATTYLWLAEEAGYVSCRAAEEVYKTLGIPDRFGFSHSSHSHCAFPSDQTAQLGLFVDKFLLGKTINTTGVSTNPFPNTDYTKWITAWKGLVLTPPNTNAPVVTITAPLTNASYAEGDNIIINATATITTGTISKIDFYQGTTLLGTDASAPYTFTWANAAAGKYEITAKATSTTNDIGTSAVISVLVTKAVFQTGAAPTIDGAIDALWGNYTAVPILNVLSGTVSSAADLSGNWKAMWDASNLYVLVQVTDDVKRNDAGTDVYNDDGVEIYFDFGNNKPTTYGANDHQYTFRWNDATAAYEINGHSVAGITKGSTNTTGGYIMEVSIPWTTIGGVPAANSLQGFDVMINDDDNGTARDKKMAWSATADDTWGNPSLMGTIVLKGLNCTPPLATITAASATTFCTGGYVTLTANAGTGFTYVWKKDNAVIAGETAASYTGSAAGSYTVTVTSGGCSATSTATAVTVNTLPIATITASTATTFCTGGSVTLTASAGTSYIWKNGTTQVGTAATYLATTSGSYTVEVTNATTCKTTSTATVVTVNAAPAAPTVVATAAYCQNGLSIPLTATGTALKWYYAASGGTAVTSISPEIATPGTTNYYVSQTLNGCESPRATIAVTINPLPSATITAGTATTFCTGGSVTLTANNGASYIWKNGTTQVGTAATYIATTSGSYSVEVTNASNCKTTSAATIVTVTAAPAAPTVTVTAAYCQNTAAIPLTAAGTGLKWYDAATGGTSAASVTPSTATPGTTNYYVSQTLNGCESPRATIAVTINPLPSATITAGTATTFCTGGSVTLTASTGTSYKWMNGSTQVGTAATYVAATSGSYTVEVTNSATCKATAPATLVTVNAGPAAPAVTGTTAYCQNAVATPLTATGVSLKWYDAATGGTSVSGFTPITSLPGTTNYYVSQITSGCESARAMIAVTVNALPEASVTVTGSTTIVEGGSVLLHANTVAGLTYKWFKGTDQISTAASYTATAEGTYYVEVTNASDCKAASPVTTIIITGNQPSVITITEPSSNSISTGAVTIAVTVDDADGEITLVEFMDGNTVIGTSTAAPHTFIWENPTSGEHTITVRVTDSNGGVTTSAGVTITSETITTGVQSANTIQGVIYPNPANADIYVDTEMDLSNAAFTVIDVLGKETQLSGSGTANGAKIDISSLSEGAYVLFVREGNSVLRKKITVIK